MVEWVVPPQKYNHNTARIDIARGFIRYALDNSQTLVFRLLKNENTSTGYQLDYRLSFAEPYLAISHAWTDRSGPGNAFTVSDLAPWPISMSPAKRGLLDWLFQVQDAGDQWTSWYWLDLFCIDQTKQDESLFSRQLQQIPQVFYNAKSCLALLASWPCDSAQIFPEIPDSDREDGRYDFVNDWLKEHTLQCSCPALMDAWLTRVWTRQELLYSRSLMLVTANIWLEHTRTDPTDTWTSQPTSFEAPRATGGTRELASCLVAWCTRYGLSTDFYSSSILADILRLLIRGEVVECFLSDASFENVDVKPSSEWFAFNWSMILNSSPRFTSSIRDVILSQMLLLPGYKVPEAPWSISLQSLIVDSYKQYRRLLGRHQLVPMLFNKCVDQQGSVNLAPTLSPSLEKASLYGFLQSIGSPCTYPRGVYNDDSCEEIARASIVGYEIEDKPRFRVLQVIDLEGSPTQAAEFFATMESLWSQAADCTATWNMRECLSEIHRETRSNDKTPEGLKMALKHYVGRLIRTTAFQREHINSKTDPSNSYSRAEIDSLALPPLAAVEILHRNTPDMPAYTNLLFGDLALGEEGPIFGLGIDKVTHLEFGLVAHESFPGGGGPLGIRASGALMPILHRNRRQQTGSIVRTFATRPIVG